MRSTPNQSQRKPRPRQTSPLSFRIAFSPCVTRFRSTLRSAPSKLPESCSTTLPDRKHAPAATRAIQTQRDQHTTANYLPSSDLPPQNRAPERVSRAASKKSVVQSRLRSVFGL